MVSSDQSDIDVIEADIKQKTDILKEKKELFK